MANSDHYVVNQGSVQICEVFKRRSPQWGVWKTNNSEL